LQLLHSDAQVFVDIVGSDTWVILTDDLFEITNGATFVTSDRVLGVSDLT